MCLYYEAKRKPSFTRLCYRYGEWRGRHVDGRWPCGTHPRPRGRNLSSTVAPAERCPCGRPSIRHLITCEECYIQQQIHTTDVDTAQIMLDSIMKNHQLVKQHCSTPDAETNKTTQNATGGNCTW